MPSAPLNDADLDQTVAFINVNAVASAVLCRAAIRFMSKRKKGSIINVASIGGVIPYFVNENYGATKSYLITLSRLINRKACKD
ncbi:MAG: SDR family NAD(P)-dependent oxidoreductase [Proteobacteria bacterium]|nr:SDR family NAD(P)-dependent oxidoreductase [Pseudomonadota bacterium]